MKTNYTKKMLTKLILSKKKKPKTTKVSEETLLVGI